MYPTRNRFFFRSCHTGVTPFFYDVLWTHGAHQIKGNVEIVRSVVVDDDDVVKKNLQKILWVVHICTAEYSNSTPKTLFANSAARVYQWHVYFEYPPRCAHVRGERSTELWKLCFPYIFVTIFFFRMRK